MSDAIRKAFEARSPPEDGAYWCHSRGCYMRDAGGGFTVSVNPQNDKWEAWQAALEHAGQAPAPVVPDVFLAHLNSVIGGVLASCEPKQSSEESQYIGGQALEELGKLESDLSAMLSATPAPPSDSEA